MRQGGLASCRVRGILDRDGTGARRLWNPGAPETGDATRMWLERVPRLRPEA